MPTLRQNDPALSLTIPVGHALTIIAPPGSSAYVADLVDFTPSGTVTGQTTVFGPYTEPQTVRVSCTAGAVSWGISVAADDNVKYRADPLTGKVKYFNGASVPIIFSFPDFSPSILASLVAGATATQSGNTVTITATAHGAVGSNAKDGYRFYYPGSASIAAGWYGGFDWIDVNTVQFTNPTAQTVGSESVNGGAAFTAQVTVCSATIEGGSIGANGKFRVNLLRDGDTSGQLKRVLAYMSATNIAYLALSTTPTMEQDITVRNIGSESVQRFSTVQDGATYPALMPASKDTALDQAISIAASLAAAGCWLSIVSTEYEVTHRD